MKRFLALAALAVLIAESAGCSSTSRLWPWRREAPEQPIYMAAPDCSAPITPRACGVVESCPATTTTAYPVAPAPVPVVTD